MKTSLSIAAVLAFAAISSQSLAEDRVALVIGNSKYEVNGSLRNPANDADAMEAVLKALGFTVIKKKDVNLAGMEDAIVSFRRDLSKGSVGLFFYAGHGLQVKGDNYFVPVDARMREEFEVKRQCLPLATVLEAMTESESNLKIVILDCCRDDPFKRSWSRSTAGGGLAALTNVPEGTVIAFATSPDKTAADGKGKNSPYTENLVKVLNSRPETGLELRDVFFDASREVKRQTGQIPWLNMEASLEKYYLTNPTMKPDAPMRVTPEKAPSKLSGSSSGVDLLTNNIGMKLKLIPAGEFLMGSPNDEEGSQDDERPQHQVRITKPFYMGIHEVTREQFAAFVKDQGYETEAERDRGGSEGSWGWNEAEGNLEYDLKYNWTNTGFAQTDAHPVVNVSWNDAVAYCEWLSKKEQRTYRLPTEAEWEYACRSGTTSPFQTGGDPDDLAIAGNIADGTLKSKLTNYQSFNFIAASDSFVFTAPVGRFRENKFGLFDMHGNVFEWCEDMYVRDAYKNRNSGVTDPVMKSGSESSRVFRGGSWFNVTTDARSSFRGSYAPSFRYSFIGFRVVAE